MLEIFRRNHFVNSFLLLFYTIVLRVSFLMSDPRADSWPDIGLFTHHLNEFFSTNAAANFIFGTLVLFFQAVYLNRIVIKNQITKDNSMLPGVFYILLHCSFPVFLQTNGALLACTFLIFALENIFKSYRLDSAADYIFNAGFWISMASMFYFPVIYLHVFAGISLISIKSMRWRDRLQLLIGAITPIFLVFTVYYFFHLENVFYKEYWLDHLGYILPPYPTTWNNIIIGIFVGFFVALCLMMYGSITSKSGIHVKKKIEILYWYILFCTLIMPFQPQFPIQGLLLYNPALGIFLAIIFLNIKSKQIAEILHLVLLLLVLISQFYF
jgi:hypothetical protein